MARPAAPLTTFLIGYAAGRQDRDVQELADRAAALAHRWAAETEDASDAAGATGAEAKPAE